MQLALQTINQRVTEVKPFPQDKHGFIIKLEDESKLNIASDSSFIDRTVFPTSINSFYDLSDKFVISIDNVLDIPQDLIDSQYQMTGGTTKIKLKSGKEFCNVTDFIKISLQETDIYVLSLGKKTRYGLTKKFEQKLNKAKLKNISGK